MRKPLMKKTLLLTCALASSITALPANAGWSFIPKIGLESKAYTLEIGPGYPSVDKEVKGSLMGLALGFTIANDNGWYFDIETFEGSGSHEGLTDSGEDEFTRGEGAISLGKAIGEGFTVFGGFRSGNNRFHYEGNEFQTGETAELQVQSAGLFVGLSKSLILSPGTSLALSAAVASMTAEFKDFDIDAQGIDATGDTLGYSLSMSFNKELMKKWNLSLGGRYQAFTYDEVKDGSRIIGDQVEKVAALFIKTSYRF